MRCIPSLIPETRHVQAPTASDPSALALTLRLLQPYLERSDVTELCINRPGELFLETASGWEQHSIPALDFDWCLRFAKLVAHDSHQRVDQHSPLLSASLPGGQRVQLVLPPAVPGGAVAMSIRRPRAQRWSIDQLAAQGIFRRTRLATTHCDPVEEELLRLLGAAELLAFMKLAVRARKNIVVSGPTGSGKTTWTRALIAEIPPQERLISIEDAPELTLDQHPNHVRLFYSKDDQGVARVTARQLLEACLRMKPDRILLAELRSEEAFDFLRNVNSGHPGSITSVHATAAALAFEQLVLLVKLSPAGRELPRADIKDLLYLLVDIVIQFDTSDHQRFIKEIWYEPARKHRALQAARL